MSLPPRDRLSSMMSSPLPPVDATYRRLAPQTQTPAAARRRALLYAPAPAPAAAYITLLEGEGYDVLLAQDLAAADTLLRAAPPQLIVAVAPALSADLVKRWQEQVPQVEIRSLSSLLGVLDERIVPPQEMTEFAVKAIASLAALLAATRGLSDQRVLRTVELAEGTACQLAVGPLEALRVRVAAALRHVPDSLAGPGEVVETDTVTDGGDPTIRRRLLAEFAQSVGCPFALGQDPPPGPLPSRAPCTEEIVEAAAQLVVLLERGDLDPSLALRRAAGAEGSRLHPAAVEAALAAWGGRRQRSERGAVLVVDPDPALRGLLALRLANEGYAVRQAASGRAALEEIREHPPALVLAETVLPGLDGFALLDSLNRRGQRLPFVFLSSRTDSLSVNKGLLLGAADFLAKPVNVEVLLTKVQKILGQSLEQGELSARLALSEVQAAGTSNYTVFRYEDLTPGVLLAGRFLIDGDLGEGGMGKVFRARDQRLEETVVLKVMKSTFTDDAKVLEHFKREIRLARKITHPGVVRIYDFFEAGPVKFVTMEYLEGQTLREEIKRRGAFPVPVVVRLAGELFEAIAAAHDVGVVHRDIKPHNVLVLQSGRIKVLDYGISQGLDPEKEDGRTLTASVMGTPEYMSPEQIMGERVDTRTDLYSAGVLLFELCTGELPFKAETRVATAGMHLNAPVLPPSARNHHVPPALDALVVSLMQKNREGRPASARAVLDELARLRRG